MRDYEQIERLTQCLEKGKEGRQYWNSHRDIPENWGLESIPEPLTLKLSNNVRVSLKPPNLWLAELQSSDLAGYDLSGAFLSGANLEGAKLAGADLSGSHLIVTNLRNADLRDADLSRANLLDADLSGSDLTGASLVGAQLLRTKISGAVFDRCNVHGVSVWGTIGEPERQNDLVITTSTEPTITVDDIEVGQFVYLILNNKKVRNVLQTITSKVVLLLGRFTECRKAVLDRLRDELRRRNLSPVLFDFDPSSNLDISDTVTLLARMARFVIADLTDPRSVQQELTLIAPQVMVPIQPIILAGQQPWSMFGDLQRRSRGLLPIHEYRDVEDLIRGLQSAVIGPAEARRAELLPSPSPPNL